MRGESRQERGMKWQPWDSRQEEDIQHPQASLGDNQQQCYIDNSEQPWDLDDTFRWRWLQQQSSASPPWTSCFLSQHHPPPPPPPATPPEVPEIRCPPSWRPRNKVYIKNQNFELTHSTSNCFLDGHFFQEKERKRKKTWEFTPKNEVPPCRQPYLSKSWLTSATKFKYPRSQPANYYFLSTQTHLKGLSCLSGLVVKNKTMKKHTTQPTSSSTLHFHSPCRHCWRKWV